MIQSRNETKPTRRPIIWRRILFYLAFLSALGLISADAWFETYGVPARVHDYIQEKLNAKGIIFIAGKIKIGLAQGLVLSDVQVKDGELKDFTLLHADRISLDFSISDLVFRQRLNLSDFSVSNGSLALPLFPECGDEGMGDILRVTELQARAKAEDRELKIDFIKGKLGKIDVGFSGCASNILPNIYGVPAAGVAAFNTKAFSPMPLLRKSSFESRAKFVKILKRFSDEDFSGRPAFLVEFDLDARNIQKSSLRASFDIPAFSYGHLTLKHIRGSIRFDNKIAELSNVHLNLGNGEFCEGSGEFNMASNSISGSFKGSSSPEKMLLFLDENTQTRIKENVDIPLAPVSYQGKLENYAINSGTYSGMLELSAPGLAIHGLKISELKTSLLLDNDRFEAKSLSAKLPDGGDLTGSCVLTNDTFSSSFEGSAQAALLYPFLNGTSSLFLKQNISAGRQPVSFKGSISVPSLKEPECQGDILVSLPSVNIRGLNLNNFTTKLSFNKRFIKANEFEATLKDGVKLSGDIVCIPEEQVFSASIFCSGSPEEVLVLLEKDHKALLDSFMADVIWPNKKSLAEAALDIHYSWGAQPSYFMSGDIVLTDFSYRGIKFDYGATKFHIDSDGLIVLPGVVVQNSDGQALIAAAYDGRSPARSKTSRQNPFLASFDTPSNRLSFTVDSSISPQNLLVCLYPPWKEQSIVFNGSSEIKAQGFVDYARPSESWYNAKIRHGRAAWNGIPLEKLDADLSFHEQNLKIENATANICGGDAAISYDYNFGTATGRIEFKLEDGNLPAVLKSVNWDKFSGLKRGELSTKLEADISYDKKDNILLNGAGHMSLENSDIWTVPFFGGMLKMIGQAWAIDKFGEVSKLECDYTLDGNRLVTNSINSDGSIIAIKGDGSYSWETKEYSFNVRAEPLKNTLPFKMASVLLSPVSWLFEARVYGKHNEVNWEQNSSLKKLF
ncbi:MAG: hypothetical protein A2X49_06100 [Lentisphaerae bacterium GWF2_52_8]|nr:MAG: hypothetical protein A2X49_06100 [Lentisphaerae bacterium GWF2_52_8]